MSEITTRWDLSEIDVAKSAVPTALNVVRRLTDNKASVIANWETAIRLAQANSASLRDIAAVAGASPADNFKDLPSLNVHL